MTSSPSVSKWFTSATFIKFLVAGVCLVFLSGCIPDDDRKSVYYVPIPGSANNDGGGGGGSAGPTGEPTVPTGSPAPVVESGWEKTCISITEFKDTYRATLIFSLSLLEDASKNSPERKFARQLKYLAKELKKSESNFSLALISPKGKEADATTAEKCGEPLLMSFSREEG